MDKRFIQLVWGFRPFQAVSILPCYESGGGGREYCSPKGKINDTLGSDPVWIYMTISVWFLVHRRMSIPLEGRLIC
jgi:hypothetical protein